jgi:hypothetical protein
MLEGSDGVVELAAREVERADRLPRLMRRRVE